MNKILCYTAMEALHVMKRRARGIPIIRNSEAANKIRTLEQLLIAQKNETLYVAQQRDELLERLARVLGEKS